MASLLRGKNSEYYRMRGDRGNGGRSDDGGESKAESVGRVGRE